MWRTTKAKQIFLTKFATFLENCLEADVVEKSFIYNIFDAKEIISNAFTISLYFCFVDG